MDIRTVLTRTEQSANEDPAVCVGREKKGQTDELRSQFVEEPSAPTVCIEGNGPLSYASALQLECSFLMCFFTFVEDI